MLLLLDHYWCSVCQPTMKLLANELKIMRQELHICNYTHTKALGCTHDDDATCPCAGAERLGLRLSWQQGLLLTAHDYLAEQQGYLQLRGPPARRGALQGWPALCQYHAGLQHRAHRPPVAAIVAA